MVEVRCMEEKDVSQVALMEQEYFSQPWSEQAFSDALLQKDYLYMVALKDTKVIGYCGMYHVVREGNITQIAVHKNYRKAGVAKKLLQDFMQKGKSLGVDVYTLEVRVSNESAYRLYESCGFQTECVRKGFYSFPKEDAFIMWRR